MPMKIPPKFCPVLHPEHAAPPEIVECKCISHTGGKGLLAEDGHSCFCMGKIKAHLFKANDAWHANNYVLCMFGPLTHSESPEIEALVVTNLINRTDMELLHGMMHKAVGPDRPFRIEGRKQGFMEADPDSEEREEVITDDAGEKVAHE